MLRPEIFNDRGKLKILLITATLFLILFPLSDNINFQQNDDWIYHKMLERFVSGNFRLLESTEAMFYAQGLLGLGFSKVFGIESIPVLTLLISVLNFFIFTNIVYRFYLKKISHAMLIGLLFFLNPLHIYSMWGFMTDNYFLFFFLASLYFVLGTLEDDHKTPKNFILANIFIILGFFVRQFSALISIVFILTLLLKRKFKYAAMQVGLFAGLMYFYLNIFPRTQQMVGNQNFQIANLLDIPKTYLVVLSFLFYLVAMSFPLILGLITKKGFSEKKNLIFLGLILIIIFLVNGLIFKNNKISDINLYYFKNSVTKEGFFYGKTLGYKYQFSSAISFLYVIWDALAKFLLPILIALVLVFRKKLLNFHSIYIVIYVGLMSVMFVIYDRYVLILVPLFILLLLSWAGNTELGKYTKVAVAFFVVFLALCAYQFSIDFILLNRYLWNRGNELVRDTGTPPTLISAGLAWRRQYYNPKFRFKYMFYFEPKEANPDIGCCFKLVETREILFPLDLFQNSKVYLYKRLF